jgi:hypothetical protein
VTQWHIYGLLAELQRALGRVETQLRINTEDLHEIKARTSVLERKRNRPDLTVWYPAIAGLIALILALAGRSDLAATVLSLSAGR